MAKSCIGDQVWKISLPCDSDELPYGKTKHEKYFTSSHQNPSLITNDCSISESSSFYESIERSISNSDRAFAVSAQTYSTPQPQEGAALLLPATS